LHISNNNRTDQITASSHQGIFSATVSTLVFLIIQWNATSNTMITETLMMASVVSKASALGTPENMDVSKCQALVKSGDRKKNKVTLMKKKVTMASIKLLNV